MTEQELISKAHDDLGENVADIDQALIAYWGHGAADEEFGNVFEPPFFHVFRVDRWLLFTNETGFSSHRAFLDEASAKEAFAQIETAEGRHLDQEVGDGLG